MRAAGYVIASLLLAGPIYGNVQADAAEKVITVKGELENLIDKAQVWHPKAKEYFAKFKPYTMPATPFEVAAQQRMSSAADASRSSVTNDLRKEFENLLDYPKCQKSVGKLLNRHSGDIGNYLRDYPMSSVRKEHVASAIVAKQAMPGAGLSYNSFNFLVSLWLKPVEWFDRRQAENGLDDLLAYCKNTATDPLTVACDSRARVGYGRFLLSEINGHFDVAGLDDIPSSLKLQAKQLSGPGTVRLRLVSLGLGPFYVDFAMRLAETAAKSP